MAKRGVTAAMAAVVLLGAAALSGCARPDIPYDQLAAKYGAASRRAELPGGLIVNYRDQGAPDGAPIVLVHGFAASLQAWEPWVQRLAADHRLISLDLPGHGLTQAPPGYRSTTERQVEVVDALTRKLGVERFVIVGNSMGGGVAWNYALAHPERVRGLVLVDAAGWPHAGQRSGGPAIFKLLANPAGRALLKSFDARPLAERGLKQAYLDPRLVTPALVDRYDELSRAPGHRDILLTMQSTPRRPVTPQTFAAIEAPTLVMAGERDRLIPVGDARALAAAIPGARLITYPGVGHVPMEQIPDRSAADLKAWLATLPP